MELKDVISRADIRLIIRQALMVGPMFEVELRIDVATELITKNLIDQINKHFVLEEK